MGTRKAELSIILLAALVLSARSAVAQEVAAHERREWALHLGVGAAVQSGTFSDANETAGWVLGGTFEYPLPGTRYRGEFGFDAFSFPAKSLGELVPGTSDTLVSAS